MEKTEDDELLHSEQSDAEQGDDHQLDRADLPQQSSVGDEAAGAAEVCVDQTVTHENKDGIKSGV